MLVKIFPIKLKDGMQSEVEDIVEEFAPKGPGPGTSPKRCT